MGRKGRKGEEEKGKNGIEEEGREGDEDIGRGVRGKEQKKGRER